MARFWIQRAISRPGKLHRELGIPKKEKISMQLLNKIINSKAGQTITNPTNKGKKRIKVTRGLERRAILARNLRRLKK